MLRFMTGFVLTVALLSIVTPTDLAAAERKVIKPRHQVSGINPNGGLRSLEAEFFVSEKGFKKMWKAWREDDPPKVDFKKELVLVLTCGGPNRPGVGVELSKEGNMRWGGGSTARGGPGFGYWIGIVSREGVKKLRAKDMPAPGDDEKKSAATEYKGTPPKGMKVLAEHQTIARYDGAPYSLCHGKTRGCPEKCGASGEFATFAITDYLHYEKKGMWGDAKQEKFRLQISDFHKKPKGNAELNKLIKGLAKGDLVQLEWKHFYNRSPVRPVLLLKKISAEEAERLKKAAKKS